MANSYVHASNFDPLSAPSRASIDSKISQRIGVIDDTPQRRVWIVTKQANGDLALTSIYTTSTGPEELTGTSYPLSDDFLTTTAVFFDQSTNTNFTASNPTIAASSGSIVVAYRRVNNNTGENEIISTSMAPSLFDTMTDSDFAPNNTVMYSATDSLLNPIIDMGPSGVLHGGWIEVNTSGNYVLAYGNTVLPGREIVFTAEAGATLDEASIIVDNDDVVHMFAVYTLGWIGASNIVYGQKDWVATPSGGWSGGGLFDGATVENIKGLSVVLDELNNFYIGYAAGNPRTGQLVTYNYVTENIEILTVEPWSAEMNVVTMGIDDDNNPHMAWTEVAVENRFFHIDFTSVFADQIMITYVGSLGGFDTASIDTSATNQISYFGAPAVGVFGKQTYRPILGGSPRYIAATLDSADRSLPSYSILPLNTSTYIPKGGTTANSTASVTNSETKSISGGTVVSPSSLLPEWIKEEGSGGAVTEGEGIDGIEYTEVISGGLTLGDDSISVILDLYVYIVDEDTSIIEIGGDAVTEIGDLPLGIQRSFTLSDLICVYSGGSNNNDTSLSVGGSSSIFEIQGTINNLFDDIEPEETEEDFIDHRCFYVYNDHPTETIYNISLWIKEEADGGADVLVGIEDVNEIQTITIDQDITGGSFKIQYEPTNPNGSGPVIVNFDPDISTWAENLKNALNNGISDLQDIEVNVASLETGVSFDVLFQGQDGKRLQELLTITDNELTPTCNITVGRQLGGKPINAVAVQLDVDTTPPTGVTFTSPTEANPITVPKLREGEGFAVWLQRSAEAGTSAVISDGLILRISVEPVPV